MFSKHEIVILKCACISDGFTLALCLGDALPPNPCRHEGCNSNQIKVSSPHASTHFSPLCGP